MTIRPPRMPKTVAVLREAVSLHQQGRIAEAEALYRVALKTAPHSFDALHFCGIACGQRGRFDEAAALIGKALKIKPDSANARNSMAKALCELGEFEKAVLHARRALELKPGYVDALNNLANALFGLERYADAAEASRRAIAIQPASAESWNNLGAAQRFLEQFDDAVASMRRAVEIQPAYGEAHHNLGTVLHRLRRYGEAADSFARAQALQPDNISALSMLLHLRMKTCDWRNLVELKGRLIDAVRGGRGAVLPFILLTVTDDPALLFGCARRYAADKTRIGSDNFPSRPLPPGGPIRVAYLSADFHQHATAFLMAEIFERHDRDRFEITAISYGPNDGSPMRKRLEAAFDHFIDARNMSDREIAQTIYDHGIHIAVDLKGYTQDCRPAALAGRPAPVQVNFLGYPGTMGAGFIDYIIADGFIAPFDMQPFFSERIVHMPDSYQPNDTSRMIAETALSRASQGLPERGLVFCCFNKGYKITPEVFDIWARLLLAVPDSVLWLFSDNPEMERNLRREAENRGVSPDRLVFAAHAPLADHLARHRLADLFLDTVPCNAHTTASDALWAGLPVLTCAGRSFAARVAGSLLNAVGMPDLVTGSLAEYESLALKLARDPGRLGELRERLAGALPAAPLFDSGRFTANLEVAYDRMWARMQGGQPPEPFSVRN